MDLIEAVSEHERQFNAAVRAGDYSEFMTTFTDDAMMAFENRPIEPLRGRAAIAAAYKAQPPTDTMSIHTIEEVDPETVDVHFDWDNGGGGSMRVRWRDGLVADMRIAFRE